MRLSRYTIIFAIITLTGILLRMASFSWNERLFGDVNLFALTAREYARSDQLNYPLKYEFSANVPYLTLSTPASQHPPLWSLAAGFLAKLFRTELTFDILKWLSFLSSLLFFVVVILQGNKFKAQLNHLIFISLIALSPVMVDFSANGSPYMLCALILYSAACLLSNSNYDLKRNTIPLAILCGMGYLVHSSLVLLPVAYFLVLFFHKTNPQPSTTPIVKKTKHAVCFLLIFSIIISPWLVWNYQQFGKPFYSYSLYYLFEKLGMVITSIDGEIVSSQINPSISISTIQTYLLIVLKSLWALLRNSVWILGPFIIVLSVLGFLQQMKHNRQRFIAQFLPAILYLVVIIVWGTYKFRFLIPLLPFVFHLAAQGIDSLINYQKWGKWLAWICMLGALLSMLPFYLKAEPALYYGAETPAIASTYDRMRKLALEMTDLEPGVVLGYSQQLDGGIETIYYHDFPFVAGRGLDLPAIQKIIDDISVRYIWCDNKNCSLLENELPNVIAILNLQPFSVYELVPPIERTCQKMHLFVMH